MLLCTAQIMGTKSVTQTPKNKTHRMTIFLPSTQLLTLCQHHLHFTELLEHYFAVERVNVKTMLFYRLDWEVLSPTRKELFYILQILQSLSRGLIKNLCKIVGKFTQGNVFFGQSKNYAPLRPEKVLKRGNATMPPFSEHTSRCCFTLRNRQYSPLLLNPMRSY